MERENGESRELQTGQIDESGSFDSAERFRTIKVVYTTSHVFNGSI